MVEQFHLGVLENICQPTKLGWRIVDVDSNFSKDWTRVTINKTSPWLQKDIVGSSIVDFPRL
jgi:hypothetical protein